LWLDAVKRPSIIERSERENRRKLADGDFPKLARLDDTEGIQRSGILGPQTVQVTQGSAILITEVGAAPGNLRHWIRAEVPISQLNTLAVIEADKIGFDGERDLFCPVFGTLKDYPNFPENP
jgi:hypothetical protein